MTDAKIIKSLECCSQDTHDCDNCPLDIAEESLCFNEIKGYALALINRQKAEVERLQKENNQFADIGKMYSEIKVETIKKFKHNVRTLFRLNFLRKKRYDKIFDEAEAMMLKEMAGETECTNPRL